MGSGLERHLGQYFPELRHHWIGAPRGNSPTLLRLCHRRGSGARQHAGTARNFINEWRGTRLIFKRVLTAPDFHESKKSSASSSSAVGLARPPRLSAASPSCSVALNVSTSTWSQRVCFGRVGHVPLRLLPSPPRPLPWSVLTLFLFFPH